jgi:hypothetical protein
VTPGPGFFDAVEGGADPALMMEAADRAAHLLVRGAPGLNRTELAEQIAELGQGEGLATLAELWSQSTPQSLAGSLWRLYLLRAFVERQPVRAAQEFAAGVPHAEVSWAVAGVAEPPGPDQVVTSIGEVLRGIATADFADVLFRAAAFAKVVATGRATMDNESAESAARLFELADQLHRAARLELKSGLN